MREDCLDLIHQYDCWEVETNDAGSFVWTKTKFRVKIPVENFLYMSLELASVVENNKMLIQPLNDQNDIELVLGWQTVDVKIENLSDISFNLEKNFIPENDERELGLMIRRIKFHSDKTLHSILLRKHENMMLNQMEYRTGREDIHSYPPYLRITISKKCNIANEVPCVYCSWDWAKKMEQGSPDFDLHFLNDLGGYIQFAEEITDCSYGEPPLEKDFSSIVDLLSRDGRVFEFTSNGQTLSKKIRNALLGKKIRLYVSIDAADDLGYLRYRDSRFDSIESNLRALCSEKKKYDNWPYITISFIVMRSNLKDIRDFMVKMKDVGVDQINFRTLFREDRLLNRVVDHYGFKFDYDIEFLLEKELTDVANVCLSLGKEIGIKTNIEWDAFLDNVASIEGSHLPICSEPWKTAYVMNRGLTPCCYGREPIVQWSTINRQSLEGSIGDALNSVEFIELRRDLASGKLGDYCKGTLGCPIVKRLLT